MSKDEKDNKTIDGLPRKRGRPVIHPEKGPMTAIERQARYKAGKVIVQLRIRKDVREKFKDICKVNGLNREEQFTLWVKRHLRAKGKKCLNT